MLFPKNNPIKSSYQHLCDVLGVSPIDIMIPKTEADVKRKTRQKKKEETTITYVDTRKVKPLKQYKSVELFAGAGGLALGLEEAGFMETGLVEVDKYAAQTLRDNRPTGT